MMNRFLAAVSAVIFLAIAQSSFGSGKTDPNLARDIMVELVAINTAPSGGNDTSEAVALLVRHLKAAGFDESEIAVLGETPNLQNLVVRYPGKSSGLRPLLLMAHLDVVEALREEWNYEPFAVTEDDGWYYGRGTNDNKAGAASLIANLIRLRNEGFESDRDLIVMLTADEESTGNATKWLLKNHRHLIDAEFALNTDGGPILVIDGKPLALMVQTSEKIFMSFALQASDPGGHSSRPHRDSAISQARKSAGRSGGLRISDRSE